MNRRQSLGAILAAAVSGLLQSFAKADSARADASPPRILVTGFGEWGSHKHNPTRDVIEALSAEGIEAHILPVTFTGSDNEFDRLYDRIKPDIVLCLGLAASTKGFRIETVAHNALNQKLRDADNTRPAAKIDPAGPDQMVTTLPVHKLAQILKQQNFPVEISKDAEKFVCENIFYHALRRASETEPRPMTGFVHISSPSKDRIDLAQQVQGVKMILAECEREFMQAPAAPGMKLQV